MRILRMTARQHAELKAHLYPGDGKEAVSLAVCGRVCDHEREVFTVREILPVEPVVCERTPVSVQWPTASVREVLARCAIEQLSVLKLHSHPGGLASFSPVDDASDQELLSAIARRLGGAHLSAVMLPDGHLFARAVDSAGRFHAVERVSIVGDDISMFERRAREAAQPADFDLRHRQLFGERTTEILRRLKVGVVGVSGTGSPIVEMLARLGVASLVLVDDDRIEAKNLNRIYGSTRADALAFRSKVVVAADHVARMGLEVSVETYASRLDDPRVRCALGACDVLFGCVDSVRGREDLAQIAVRAIVPYLDLGVRLDADGEGGVSSVSAAVHFLQPGGSSLKSRGVYDDADLYAEHLHRSDPDAYADQLQRGYVRGVRVESPAVISVNTAIAATAINELLARLHPFRSRPNRDFAIQRLLMSHGRWVQGTDGDPDLELARSLGEGLPAQDRLEHAA